MATLATAGQPRPVLANWEELNRASPLVEESLVDTACRVALHLEGIAFALGNIEGDDLPGQIGPSLAQNVDLAIATSPDGATWTQRTGGFGTDAIRGIVYGNGLFVAVGDSGSLATSPDGATWTQRTSSFGATITYGVAYGNGLFVVVGGIAELLTSRNTKCDVRK